MTIADQVLTALRTRLATIATLPTLRYWQNIVPSSAATNRDAYTQDALQLGTKAPLTLATDASGRRWWRWTGGLYRVSLHYPAQTHMHVPLAVADAVAMAFHGASLLTSGGTPVVVESVRVPPGVGDDTGVTVPVEIRFRFDQFDT